MNSIKCKHNMHMIEYYKSKIMRSQLVKRIIKLILIKLFIRRVWWVVEVLKWVDLLMIKVRWVEQLLVVSGAKKEMDNIVHISKVILILQQSKINFEMFKIIQQEDMKDLLCKRSLKLNVFKNIDPKESLTLRQSEMNKRTTELTSGTNISIRWWQIRNVKKLWKKSIKLFWISEMKKWWRKMLELLKTQNKN